MLMLPCVRAGAQPRSDAGVRSCGGGEVFDGKLGGRRSVETADRCRRPLDDVAMPSPWFQTRRSGRLRQTSSLRSAAGDGVIALAAVKDVGARRTGYGVVAAAAIDESGRAASQRVVAVAAEDGGIGGDARRSTVSFPCPHR